MKKLIPFKNALCSMLILAFTISQTLAQQNLKLLSNHLKLEAEKNNWLPSDITEYNITDQYKDNITGIEHVYIQQKYHDIIVYNAISVFAIKDNKVGYFKAGLIKNLAKLVNSDIPKILPEEAIKFALIHHDKQVTSISKLMQQNSSLNQYFYSLPDFSNRNIKVQLVYRNTENNVLLAWDVSIDMINENHWWNIRVDALTGKFIDENDYTVECVFGNNAISNFNGNDETDSYFAIESVPPTPVTFPSYNVFAFPLEAPSFGNRVLLTNPGSLSASPYGWLDVDGIPGEDYTITRGNNVYAYEDANNDNLPGYSPNGGASLNFNFPYSAFATPITNQDVSLTNLFYDNNAIHDYLYPFGFNELAGNFQQNNYANGGQSADYVLAEGFDGSGTNNANFSTPPDGASGRMQMYLFTGTTASCTNLNITSSTFNGPMNIGTATFSPAASVTANVILINDNVGTVTDGCTAITNNISGKIALIDRGICSFIIKAQAAIAAGAVGVIIANNTTGVANAMTGTPVLAIPSISISQADGIILKNALIAGAVTATINTCTTSNQIDGSLDNGIVAHEYGHGVSNRLTGGPSQASCLENAEQGGEGWSDWLALMMTMKSGDQGTTARGIGTFAKGQSAVGPGIRRYPYSTNMSINPQTYASIAAYTEVHAVGEIWCDVIWDMSWLLIDQYGFSANSSITTAGNNIAIRLVLEGMKLQPCNPGFLDARDAILTADALLYNNEHRCMIWTAFARRGMGFNALQGSAYVAGDETAGFILPPFCLPVTQAPIAAFTSDFTTISCGSTVKFTDQSIQAFDWSWNFGDQSTSTLQNPTHTFNSPGTYTVSLYVTNPLGNNTITHTIVVNPTFSVNVTATPTSICSGGTVILNAIASGSPYRSYTVSVIPYAPLTGTDIAVTLTDDQMSTAKPIGFTFNFFGTNYTNFYMSSNGFITFSSGMPATPVYGQPIPSTIDPDNFIAIAWNDLNPANAGSSISYFTTGTSPNRKLVVKFNTSHYGGTFYPFIAQAILYEGSNLIDIHSTTVSNVSAFDLAATTTQGLENANGSGGVAIPGRNATLFTATNDAYRFTPYSPYGYSWTPGNLIGAAQTITPTATGSYTANATDGTSCFMLVNTPIITVNPCTLALNLKMYIQGLYLGNGQMQPLLNTVGLSSNPLACDSMIVELRDPLNLTSVFNSQKVLLKTNGLANAIYPNSIIGNSYYIIIRHRNSIETWSKNPVLFSSSLVSFDFTAP